MKSDEWYFKELELNPIYRLDNEGTKEWKNQGSVINLTNHILYSKLCSCLGKKNTMMN